MSRLRRALALASGVALLALAALVVAQAPEGAFDKLREARPLPMLAGLAVYGSAYLARAVRLNLLLPKEDRIPFLRAYALSGATTFLLQVIPFRGGEVASWAAMRRELGMGWTRAGTTLLLVKIIDTATTLVVGLLGAAALASRRATPTLGTGAALLAGVGTVALVLIPFLAAPLARFLPEGSRRREVALGLRAPRLYFPAFGFGLLFMAGHLAGLYLLITGLGVTVSVAGIAFATLASVLSAAVIPSPAGTFGSMEGGFAAGLALDGVAPALGVVVGAVVHILSTGVTGLIAAPLSLQSRRAPEE